MAIFGIKKRKDEKLLQSAVATKSAAAKGANDYGANDDQKTP